MAVDEVLAGRVREIIRGREVEFTEKRMFGAVVFMVAGAIALGVRAGGGLLVRCAPEDSASLQECEGASPARMGQRAMGVGWLDVHPGTVADDEALGRWVTTALARRC